MQGIRTYELLISRKLVLQVFVLELVNVSYNVDEIDVFKPLLSNLGSQKRDGCLFRHELGSPLGDQEMQVTVLALLQVSLFVGNDQVLVADFAEVLLELPLVKHLLELGEGKEVKLHLKGVFLGDVLFPHVLSIVVVHFVGDVDESLDYIQSRIVICTVELQHQLIVPVSESFLQLPDLLFLLIDTFFQLRVYSEERVLELAVRTLILVVLFEPALYLHVFVVEKGTELGVQLRGGLALEDVFVHLRLDDAFRGNEVRGDAVGEEEEVEGEDKLGEGNPDEEVEGNEFDEVFLDFAPFQELLYVHVDRGPFFQLNFSKVISIYFHFLKRPLALHVELPIPLYHLLRLELDVLNQLQGFQLVRLSSYLRGQSLFIRVYRLRVLGQRNFLDLN